MKKLDKIVLKSYSKDMSWRKCCTLNEDCNILDKYFGKYITEDSEYYYPNKDCLFLL